MSLSESKVKSAKPQDKPYRLADSGGLTLRVNANGSKYWQLRYRYENKENTLSLGTYPTVTLSEARMERDKVKKLLSQGISPKANEERLQAQKEKQINLQSIALQWVQCQHKWSENHRNRVARTLEVYLFPVLGDRPISELTTKDLLIPIKLVEQEGKTELASRLQQRINAMMRYAVQQGHIQYNPAQDLVGCVMKPKVVHRPALELERLPELLHDFEQYRGRLITKLALQLTLLIFIRSSELRFARWSEIDFEKRIWTIPAEREEIPDTRYSYRGSKMKTPHLVPLSHQAIDILKQLHAISGHYELVFIGDHNPYKVMSEGTINHALRRMGYDTKTQVCGHGFRTMACSALVESSIWSRDAIERQMSHQERNGVRAAYIHKAEHISERIKMVQWWADYLDAIKEKFIMPYEFKPHL